MSRFETIDVTRLRWFVAVAEQLHFARAAKSLNISRQRLSRTVIDLEEELGVRLFVPGAQPTELTEDGRALLAQAPELIAAAGVEVDTAEPAETTLRVGFVPGVTVSKWTRIWGERFPGIALEVTPVPQAEQVAALREGRVDMCFVRLPVDRDGLAAIPLYREVAVVVVPKDHPIAVFDAVTAAELAEEKVQTEHALDDAAVTLEMVAAGVGHAIVPHSVARLHARKDLVYRPVSDAPATEIALAWPSAATGPVIEDFIGVVRGRSEHSSRARTPATPRPRAQGKPSADKGGKKRQPVARKQVKRRGR
ncbi:LysR family transcriptional regulator [Nocardia takedensis]